MNQFQIMTLTPAGELYLTASGVGVCSISWTNSKGQRVLDLSEVSDQSARSHLHLAVQQVNEYFKGQRKKFELPLVFEGTEFQKKVWKELNKIPYGQTRNYSQVAAKVGRPNAMRAVGTANRRNPLGLVVPCHRVIAKNGSLAGYAGGLGVKEKLLTLEGASIR